MKVLEYKQKRNEEAEQKKSVRVARRDNKKRTSEQVGGEGAWLGGRPQECSAWLAGKKAHDILSSLVTHEVNFYDE